MNKTCNYKKPRIGQKVYIVFRGQITQEVVGYLGKETWIPEGFKDFYEEYMEFPYEYKTLNPETRWFTTLKQAKEELLRQETEFKKIKKVRDGLWEVI